MPIWDHLDELRERVIVAALAAGTAVLTCFAFSKDLVVFLEAPVASQGVRFLQLSPGEFFFTTLKVICSALDCTHMHSCVKTYKLIWFPDQVNTLRLSHLPMLLIRSNTSESLHCKPAHKGYDCKDGTQSSCTWFAHSIVVSNLGLDRWHTKQLSILRYL